MKYFEKIDGLRFIAIAAVMLHHIASIFSTYIDLGYFGVDLFFVISGFLITSILLMSKGSFLSDYKVFLARRSLRIFPLYYFALFVLYLLGDPVVHEEIIYLLTYTFNYRFPFLDRPNPVGHFWSLAVEEQFYLFWPLVVLGLRKKPKVLLKVTVVMIAFAYLQIHLNLIPGISKFNYSGLPARMGSLGLGAFGAMLFLASPSWLIALLKNQFVEYATYFLWVFSLVFFIPVLLGLCSLFFVLKAANNSFYLRLFDQLLSHKFVLYIGRISYGLYVYHVIIIFYATPHLFDPIWKSIDFSEWGMFSVIQYHSWVIKLPLYSALSILVAELSFRYFEQPILKLKKRYFSYHA